MRLCIRALLHALRKPFHVPPLKRREAERRQAHHGFRPAAEKKACQRMRRAPSLPPANGAGSNGGALAFRRPTAVMRRGSLSLDSAPGRASWNHRIQTGGPSPAPVQPAPGSPVTRRTVDAQNRPDMQCIAASPGTAPAPPRIFFLLLSSYPSPQAAIRCSASREFNVPHACLLLDRAVERDGVVTNEIKRQTGKSKTCVWRRQERFMQEGYCGLLRHKHAPRVSRPLNRILLNVS